MIFLCIFLSAVLMYGGYTIYKLYVNMKRSQREFKIEMEKFIEEMDILHDQLMEQIKPKPRSFIKKKNAESRL